MNGLRVYSELKASAVPSANPSFYTRRAGGPYYRWRYETLSARWQWSRMNALELAETELVAARWTAVPAELRLTLIEHYQE